MHDWSRSYRRLPFFSANQTLFWFSSQMPLWSGISFYLAVFINLLIAFYYPFSENSGVYDATISGAAWTATFMSLAVLIMFPSSNALKAFICCLIFRLICYLSVGPVLKLMGAVMCVHRFLLVSSHIWTDFVYLCYTGINIFLFIVSLGGNRGTFNQPLREMLTNKELLYLIGYMFFVWLASCCTHFFTAFWWVSRCRWFKSCR